MPVMDLFDRMRELGHERVCLHQDPATGLRAIVAIHSTVLGNALGGTRRWAYACSDEAIEDVLRLSEGMTYKAAAADLPMGGAKSIIMLDKPGQQPTEAEGRAMGRFVETFSGAYIAAEDVGVSPQFCDWMAMETRHIMGGENVSVGGDPSPWTSQGVFNSMKACLTHLGTSTDFSRLTIGIQGCGATGFKLAKLCREAGAAVLVTDVHVPSMKRCVEELGCMAIGNDRNLFHEKLDILAPCALGAVLGPDTIPNLRCRMICGTANNQLVDPVRDGRALQERGIIYSPDFVANAGGLIRLAGLYLGMDEATIDRKVAAIERTTLEVFRESANAPSTAEAAIAYAKRRIEKGRPVEAAAGR
jgi:leucine dehydrogenase